MSYTQVIRHVQRILNQCGDPVILSLTGDQVMGDPSQMTLGIDRVFIKKQNNNFTIPAPSLTCTENPDGGFWINRIRISPSLADDYSKNYPLKDDELMNLIAKKETLFACF